MHTVYSRINQPYDNTRSKKLPTPLNEPQINIPINREITSAGLQITAHHNHYHTKITVHKCADRSRKSDGWSSTTRYCATENDPVNRVYGGFKESTMKLGPKRK